VVPRDDFDELLNEALEKYGSRASDGMAGRVLTHVDAARQRQRVLWRRVGMAGAGLAAAAALALAFWLQRPTLMPSAPALAAKPQVAKSEPVVPQEERTILFPPRGARHAVARARTVTANERSRPFAIVPAPAEVRQLALALKDHKDAIDGTPSDKSININPVEIRAIEIQPIQIAGISN
jgi:hypothetical protein